MQIIFGCIGIANGIFISFILFTRKEYHLSNILLAFLMIALSLKISYSFYVSILPKYTIFSYAIYLLAHSGYLVIGPLVFFYIKSVYLATIKTLSYMLHIAVPVIMPFILFAFGIDIPLWCLQAYYLIFLIASFHFYYKNSKSTKNEYLKPIKRWLFAFLISFSVLWMGVNFLFINFSFYIYELSIILTIQIYVSAYIILNLYSRYKSVSSGQKYKSSNLNMEELNNLYIKLKNHFNTNKSYLSPNLYLPELAKELYTTPHKLSQVINQKANMNFTEFVNYYRVHDIKKALQNGDFKNLTIEGIAFEHGFNSISTFNAAFKKITNKTPSQFKNEIEQT